MIKDQIISGTISNIVASVILALLAVAILDEKRVLRPWIYKLFRPIVGQALQFLLDFINMIVHPLTRVVLIALFLVLINLANNDFLYSILILLVALSFLARREHGHYFSSAPKLIDGFENLNKWKIKTGNPIIEKDFGKPAPDLGLKIDPKQATNSFVLLKNEEVERGVIECDFYLEPNAVFNIVFFCDEQKDNWFMARYDSRKTDSDGFLIKDGGPGMNWRFHSMSGTQTSAKTWHRARVEFSSTKASMYKDNELVVQIENPASFGKSIGLFNEVQHVHVDNFSLSDAKI